MVVSLLFFCFSLTYHQEKTSFPLRMETVVSHKLVMLGLLLG
jgi:hypothetical protein